LLSEIYQKEGNWVEAFKMQNQYIIMRDSLRNIGIEKRLFKQQAKYDLEKKDQEVELLASKNLVLEKNQNLQKLLLKESKFKSVLILAALILTILLLIVLYSIYRKKILINSLLEIQKVEAETKNEEKSIMLKEIHHRVKNNLQVINSLLRLQSSGIKDENVVDLFKGAQKRVLSMARLHEKMYQSENLKHIDVEEYITVLIKDLIAAYSVGQKVKLNIQVDQVLMGIQALVPLGLIVNEIITNSLKYAFKNNDDATIKVSLRRTTKDNYEMIIGDNGVNVNYDLNPTGLGTKLVALFVKQLEGTISRLPEEGVVYKINFINID